jgi:SAM-dependent methyltransferase
MPVSAWMIERLALQPGQTVLELAAGPGDTGFLAAELIAPGGTLISSDASGPMLDVARERAKLLGISNVEFKQLQLEWIDLPTASVDAVICRWGVMLIVDPAAALREMRRVVKAGGRAALAVWDAPDENPWATIPMRTLIDLGHAEPPDPDEPGMFALAASGRLQELLEETGFVDVVVGSVELVRTADDARAFLAETLDMSMPVAEIYDRLDEASRDEVIQAIVQRAQPFAGPDGSLRLPGRSLVACAGA